VMLRPKAASSYLPYSHRYRRQRADAKEGQRVVAEAVDGDVFVEPEHAGLPVEGAPFVGGQAELLAAG
jgi:hypothetical protein